MNCLVDPELLESERELVHRIYLKAAELLQRNNRLEPMVIFRVGLRPLLTGLQPGMIVLLTTTMPGSDEGRDAVANLLRHVRRQLDADLVVMVLESWIVKPTPEEVRYLQEHGEWEIRPSQHPRRREVVLFNLAKPNGNSWYAWAEIHRDANGQASIPNTPPKLKYLRSEGRFADLFSEEGGESYGTFGTSFCTVSR